MLNTPTEYPQGHTRTCFWSERDSSAAERNRAFSASSVLIFPFSSLIRAALAASPPPAPEPPLVPPTIPPALETAVVPWDTTARILLPASVAFKSVDISSEGLRCFSINKGRWRRHTSHHPPKKNHGGRRTGDHGHRQGPQQGRWKDTRERVRRPLGFKLIMIGCALLPLNQSTAESDGLCCKNVCAHALSMMSS